MTNQARRIIPRRSHNSLLSRPLRRPHSLRHNQQRLVSLLQYRDCLTAYNPNLLNPLLWKRHNIRRLPSHLNTPNSLPRTSCQRSHRLDLSRETIFYEQHIKIPRFFYLPPACLLMAASREIRGQKRSAILTELRRQSVPEAKRRESRPRLSRNIRYTLSTL
jgi:hypothetical protein